MLLVAAAANNLDSPLPIPQLPAIRTNESPLITTTTHAEICARVLALRDNGAPDICASEWGTPTLQKENKCARAVSIEHNYVKYLSLARS